MLLHHDGIIYITIKRLFSVHWLKRYNGNEVGMVHGYTFYGRRKKAKTQIWDCTNSRCRARLLMTSHDDPTMREVIDARLNHNHLPPRYYINTKGFFIKLK